MREHGEMLDSVTEQVRVFNRFYTRQIGLLREGLLDTPYSLTQARILYELGARTAVRSSDLVRDLALDAGYLSRLLKNLERQGMVKRTASKSDGRVQHLAMTAKGRREFGCLNARSRAQIDELLSRVPEARQRQLVDSMATIRDVLEPPANTAPSIELRPHQPGDIGWVVARHGEIYAQEYQWDATFEGLVAEIAGKFLLHFDPKRERCWIAERNGQRAGCVFLVKQAKTVAKLRLLLVEPSARGSGIGSRLVDECVAFARRAGYKKITLWTNDVLHAARRIYQRAGFGLVKEEHHSSFGQDLVGQFWEKRI